MQPEIFFANYHQITLDAQNKLYTLIKTYQTLPQFDQIIAYVDTADTGNDYLCAIVAGLYDNEAYLLDVLYNDSGMEVTEPLTAKLLYDNGVNVTHIESNNGGRGFARAVEKILESQYKTRKCIIKWFHQSKNKQARILSNSNFVMEHIYFPHNWNIRFPEFYRDINVYVRKGKNKHDDAPDCLTGIAENTEQKKQWKAFGWGR